MGVVELSDRPRSGLEVAVPGASDWPGVHFRQSMDQLLKPLFTVAFRKFFTLARG